MRPWPLATSKGPFRPGAKYHSEPSDFVPSRPGPSDNAMIERTWGGLDTVQAQATGQIQGTIYFRPSISASSRGGKRSKTEGIEEEAA